MKDLKPQRKSLLSKTGIRREQIMYMLIADISYALALNLFYVGNNIAAGGLAGIGTVLNYFFSLPIGMTVLVMTIPIVILGARIKGKVYVITSLVATVVYSAIVDLLAFLPCITDDKIVAVVFGGILYGFGSSMTIKAHLSSGGTDLIAKLLITKIRSASLGTLYMFIDGTIVVIAMVSYGNIESGIYALLAIAVCSIVTDKMTSGFNRAQMFYIFVNQNTDRITDAILNDMQRGVTSIDGTGKYSGAHKEILLVVVKPHETPRLKEIVMSFDPSAFIVLVSANEIIGYGFESTNLTETVNDTSAIV